MFSQRCKQVRIGVLAVAAITAALGCHHTQTMPQNAPVAADEPKLNNKQVADVHIAMGRSLEKRGELAQALVEYQEAVKRDGKRADAYYHMGTVYAQLGRFDEATAQFQKALTLTPGDANLFCDMGYCLLLQGRLDEARMNLRQAVVLEPNHERAHNNLGLVLAHAGQHAEALAEFAKAGCEESDARCNLAFVMTLQGQRAAAKHEYRQALALNPASETAKKGLHELDAMAGRDQPTTQQQPVLPASYAK